jgi:hypothetical protein
MLGKSIAGIDLIKFLHHTVSGNLGYDRSTGNGETQLIASGYSSLRDGTLGQCHSINQKKAGLSGQFFHRVHHSQFGGLKDIHRVNHLRRDDANANSHTFIRDEVKENLALLVVQILTVPDKLEPSQTGWMGQANGAGHNRPGQSTPPDFVNASHKVIALRFELDLVVKVW